ncbi:ABC transporter ATP-binding protein [Enterococcus sp. N342-3-1-2]
MIRLEGVTKSYNKKNILTNANFLAKEGEITLLTGKSGSGKSTLLNIISGIQVYDSGNYFVNKVKLDVDDDRYMSQFRNAKIGYIVQDYALIEDYSVLENILLPSMYNKKFEKKDIQDKANVLAKDFGLFDSIDKKVKHISGGQKQRTAIARSLILDPAIILADEPTTNLDEENFLLIIELFEALKRAKKLIIIATHDDRIKSIANKIYRIDGTILNKNLDYRML